MEEGPMNHRIVGWYRGLIESNEIDALVKVGFLYMSNEMLVSFLVYDKSKKLFFFNIFYYLSEVNIWRNAINEI